jgi:hypothetical protein
MQVLKSVSGLVVRHPDHVEERFRSLLIGKIDTVMDVQCDPVNRHGCRHSARKNHLDLVLVGKPTGKSGQVVDYVTAIGMEDVRAILVVPRTRLWVYRIIRVARDVIALIYKRNFTVMCLGELTRDYRTCESSPNNKARPLS